jgi:GR25 family glycosyltransferase involved in LPS biosynthesis
MRNQAIFNLSWFVINVDSEHARWDSCRNEADKNGLNLIKVPAILFSDLPDGTNAFVTQGVQAVWLSHMRVLEIFLRTDSNHCVILEDDFHIPNLSKFKERTHSIVLKDWDLIQLGFLTPGMDDLLKQLIANIESSVFSLISKFASSFPNISRSLSTRLRVREASVLPRGFVTRDFQPGGHCYIVSRNLALGVLKLNNPTFLCVDDFYMALSRMRSFRAIRIRKSLVSQLPFKKWDGPRFIFDLIGK